MSILVAAIFAGCTGTHDEEVAENEKPGNSSSPGNDSSAPNSGSQTVTGVARFREVSRTEIEGYAGTPFAGTVNGLSGIFTVTSTADQRTSVVFVDPSTGSIESIADLNSPGSRSYAEGVQLSTDTLAIPFQSTAGFSGQTGTEQGLSFIAPTGYVLDRNFYSYGVTRPEAVVELGENIYMAFTNGGITLTDADLAYGVVPYADPGSLVSLPLYDLQAEPSFSSFADGLNTSSLAIMQDGASAMLVSASTGGNVLVESEEAQVSVLDPDTREVEASYRLPSGTGLELAVDGSDILACGTTYSGDSVSLIGGGNDVAQSFNLFDLGLSESGSSDYGDSYVVDCEFGPDNSLITTLMDADGARLAAFNPDTLETSLTTLTDNASIMPSTLATLDSAFCLVLGGTRAATEEEVSDGMTPGTVFSELVCFEAE